MADLRDHPAVEDRGARGARAGPIGYQAHAGSDPLAERLHALGARDHVPALLLEQPRGNRVAVGHPDAELAPLPLAKHDLAEIRHHLRLEA